MFGDKDLSNDIKEAIEKLEYKERNKDEKNKESNINKENKTILQKDKGFEKTNQEYKPLFTKSRILLIISAFIVISIPMIYRYLSYYFL